MRAILQKRGLRYIFAANMISMLGSGMNAAAMAWYILQATHSKMALGLFAVLQTLPAMLMLPFTGVLIDREDRRRLVMWLDAVRAIVILTVAVLALTNRVKLWEVYLMNTLVAAGFWMFWPTITALIQELTPDEEFVHANTFLLAGIQGGWLIAGSIVGFVYNHIGLGGVLLIDCSTYLVSFLCYFAVRKGRHVVPRPSELRADIVAAETAFGRFLREMHEGIQFVRGDRPLILLGTIPGCDADCRCRHCAVERSGVSSWGCWIRLAECGLGRWRVSECAICAADDRPGERPAFDCDLHGRTRHLHELGAAVSCAGHRCGGLRNHGIGARRERDRDQ